jgi:hypothetical protein
MDVIEFQNPLLAGQQNLDQPQPRESLALTATPTMQRVTRSNVQQLMRSSPALLLSGWPASNAVG